jgi:tetratricopeptide (TPR) repeat protein
MLSSWVLSDLKAQTIAELCHQIEVTYAHCDLDRTKELGKQLREKAHQETIKDSVSFVRAMLKYASARNLYAEEPIYTEMAPIAPKETEVFAELLLEQGNNHASKYRLVVADSMISQGLALLKKLGKEQSYSYVRGLCFLSALIDKKGDLIRAGKSWDDCLVRYRQLKIEPDRLLARIFNSLASHYLVAGDLDKAAKIASESIEIYNQSCPPANSDFLASQFMYATILLQADRVKEADDVIQKILSVSKEAYTTESGNYARGVELKGDLLNLTGVFEEAKTSYLEAIGIYERLKMSDYYLFNAWLKYAYCLLELEEKDAARKAAETAGKYKTDDTMEAFLLDIYATCAGSPEEAVVFRKKSTDLFKKMTERADCGGYGKTLLQLVQDLLQTGKRAEAESVLLDFKDYQNFVYEQNSTYIDYLCESWVKKQR